MTQATSPKDAIDLTDLKKYRSDKRHQILLSVDLGKYQDFSAFTVSEVKPERFTNLRGERKEAMHIYVRDIQRLPFGTTYDKVAEIIHDVFWDRRLWLIDDATTYPIGPTLLVDEGGVGHGVTDTLAKNLGVGFIRYSLVRGTATSRRIKSWRYSIARTVMFQELYDARAADRIHIDPKLKLATTLLEELRNLKPETNEETGEVRVTIAKAPTMT